MSEKPKVALYWCASCGGCEESVVDLAEGILEVVAAVDIVFWPVALDFKKADVEAMEDGAILATLVNGAVRTSEQEEMAQLLRRKSKVLIAYGACAHLGGIVSLANQFDRDEVMEYVYQEAPSVVNDENTRPHVSSAENGRVASLPEFRNVVRALDQVVDVDYYIPGCPPTPNLLKGALDVLLSGALPPKGATLAPDVALCDQCPRKKSKPTDVQFAEFKRPHLVDLDAETCFLAQGVVCMGPATRGGCEALCTKGNMPCTGCFGPTSRVVDQGAKILSSLSANVDVKDEAAIDHILDGIPDPMGTFYRYGMARSLMRRKVPTRQGNGRG
jgi:F420-non-reducing hydrogenase small subunit